MEFHPDMGYIENDVNLADIDLYKSAQLPYGQATILPLFSYQSKIFSELEDEKLWTRNWIAIGSSKEIPNPGDMLTYTVGHHGIHVQKETDGSLIGRFNKAQHGGCRAVPLQCQTGKKTKCSFTSCGYSRDRQVINVEEIGENTPVMHQYLGLIPERLLPVKVETLGDIVFINLDQECNDPTNTFEQLPDSVKSILSNKFSLKHSEWFECKSNWKLAGRSFFDNQVSCKPDINNSNDQSITLDAFLTSHLTTHSMGVMTLKNIEDVEICWLFPNLILIMHSSFLINIILQPTSMGECILRTSMYTNDAINENTNLQMPNEWQNYLNIISSSAHTMQKRTDDLTAPGAPELTADMIPIENNIAGHVFNQYVSKKINTAHEYYWNAPLYNNNVTR